MKYVCTLCGYVYDDEVEEVKDDPRIKLLNVDPGDTLDAFQMKKAMVEDYLLGRGGYAYIRRNRNEVTGLFYTKEIYVSAIPNFKPIFKDYQILVLGEEHYKHEFIKLLKENLKPNAQMDFLIIDHKKPMVAFLDIHNVCMNADIDDPNNKNRGGVVFTIKEELMK